MQKFEHGGDLKKIMAQENLDKIIDFSANINPYGLSKNIKKAIVDHIDDIIHYPEPDARELCGKIAENRESTSCTITARRSRPIPVSMFLCSSSV